MEHDDPRHLRRGLLVLVAIVLAVGVGLAVRFMRSTPEPEVPIAAAGPACTATISGGDRQAAQSVTLRPGTPLTVAVRCGRPVATVQLVVTAMVPGEPPPGIVAAVPMEPQSPTQWVSNGEVPDLTPGTALTFWIYVDGEPHGSVTLTITK